MKACNQDVPLSLFDPFVLDLQQPPPAYVPTPPSLSIMTSGTSEKRAAINISGGICPERRLVERKVRDEFHRAGLTRSSHRQTSLVMKM